MKASSVYSKSLKIDDVPEGRALTLTINACKLFKFQGQNDRIEINFGECDKTLVLNVTNNDFLVAKLGDETDEWPGAKIKLSRKKLDRPFKGNTHTLAIVAAMRAPTVNGGTIQPANASNNDTFDDAPADFEAF